MTINVLVDMEHEHERADVVHAMLHDGFMEAAALAIQDAHRERKVSRRRFLQSTRWRPRQRISKTPWALKCHCVFSWCGLTNSTRESTH